MAPQAAETQAASGTSPSDMAVPRGPNPGSVTLSAPFISQVKIDRMKNDLAMDPIKEETSRLQGVELIHKARTAILLPVKTFDTACCYYHKFRLCYRDTEYNYQDVALAALFVACKTEDTPKKSREILCAAYNLKSTSDQKTPDDKAFDQPSKVVIGLERMILELVSFDMSGRYPQHALPKVVRGLLPEDDKAAAKAVFEMAYDMSIDMYKTYAPLKQTTYTMAISLFELACRLLDRHQDVVSRINPRRWHTSRACVVETMLDLLDLYSDCHKNTLLCSQERGHNVSYSRFLQVKIDLNQEVEDTPSLERYSLYCPQCKCVPLPKGTSSGLSNATPNIFGIPIRFNTGIAFTASGDSLGGTPGSGSVTSPASVNGSSSKRQGSTSGPSSGGNGTGPTRFVFDREEARREGERVNDFFEDRYEEYEEEVEETIPEQTLPASNPPTAPAEARRGGPPRGPYGDGWGRRRGGGGGPYDRRGPGPRAFH